MFTVLPGVKFLAATIRFVRLESRTVELGAGAVNCPDPGQGFTVGGAVGGGVEPAPEVAVDVGCGVELECGVAPGVVPGDRLPAGVGST